MKKDILVIAHFTGESGGKDNNRFNYIMKLLANENCEKAELITSAFSHTKKTHRVNSHDSVDYRLTLIPEPGYARNVSVQRLFSHYIMGRNLSRYLNSRKTPDVIFCAVPSLDVAGVTARYAKKKGIRFLIDIQDLWPEAFKMALNIPVISDILFYPMQLQADHIYRSADEIIAVSETYADIGLRANRMNKKAHAVYLGTELDTFDKFACENPVMDKHKDEFWVGYVGTLGHSYNISCVIESFRILKDRGFGDIKFVVMGDGPMKERFEAEAAQKNICCEFMGRIDYGKMVGVLKACDVAVNPIASGSAASIINKHADYVAAGLPIINTQESIEFRKLIIERNIGFNCSNDDPADMADKILMLRNDHKLRSEMGRNSRILAEERFDRAKTYRIITDLILNDPHMEELL